MHDTVVCADGTRYTASYRLATTLTDHRYPAAALIRLDHERRVHDMRPAHLVLRDPARRTGAALGRPVGQSRRSGTAGPLPGTAPRHGHRRRNPPGAGPAVPDSPLPWNPAKQTLTGAADVVTEAGDMAGPYRRAQRSPSLMSQYVINRIRQVTNHKDG